MASKSLSKALRITNSISTIGSSKTFPRRTLTSSAVLWKHGSVPSFQPASSPELDEMFASVRNKIFLPYHLPKAQQALVFGDPAKSGVDLAAEPVRATIHGEEFQLEHINVTKDLPNYWKSILQAISQAETKADYDNIATLLIGFTEIGYKINEKRCIRIIKELERKRRLDVVLELARRESTTGFGFPTTATSRVWMNALQRMALESEWESQTTNKALVWLEMFHDLSQEPSRQWAVPKDTIYSILLELSAVHATRHLDGKDTEGKVANYAEKFLAAKDTSPVLENQGHEISDAQILANEQVSIYSRALARHATTLHACKLALPILNTNASVAKHLDVKISELEVEAERLQKVIGGAGVTRELGGVALYKKLLGPNAV